MNDQTLDCVELETGPQPRLCIVWLHGLGADGHDFAPIVPELGLSVPARFVFPHAPMRSITINGGMRMRAWFDILTLERGGVEDVTAIAASAAAVAAVIDAQREAGFPAERIVLAGFSQGGALALHLGLRYPMRLGGIAALSAFLVVAGQLQREAASDRYDLPIFLAHGTYDNVIELPFAERGRDQLRAAGFAPQWHSYPMGHAVCPAEIRALSVWLGQRALEPGGAPGAS
ncbi:MAG TPA: PHB depolymerase family esterase [Gammaproteobacteria bacterium]|nr:PHB depolymerase family esterase [Gammaproteobacteria bacterium]